MSEYDGIAPRLVDSAERGEEEGSAGLPGKGVVLGEGGREIQRFRLLRLTAGDGPNTQSALVVAPENKCRKWRPAFAAVVSLLNQ